MCRRLSTLSMEVPTVTDLVSLLSSCVARRLGRRKLSFEERTLYNAKRSSQLGSQVGGLQMRPPPPYIHMNGSV